MADKETVVVDSGERRTHNGWIVALVIIGLILLFFMFGGASMFGGAGAGTGTDTTTTTPTSAPTTTPSTGAGQ